ncbi:hypothetical protein BJV82DRAFT_667705 [Fennellomyces sp. T-0311]|nr:hypothetical protein BJV82DRAFT_667705 [Fennellomyces sp. T-0311]
MDVIPDEQAIMIYGGDDGGARDMQKPAMLYDAVSETWKQYPNPMPSLKQMQFGTLSRGDNGKAYVFGGRSVLRLRPVFPPFNNAMHIYDYAAGSWTDGATLPNGITVRFYTPVTLAGNELVYIGGMTADYNATSIIRDNIPVPLSNILIYNIDENTWRQENATGNIPSNRIAHTIASKPNTRQIILYGGQTNQSTGPIEANYCYTLDLEAMIWEKKNPIGVGPGPLYGHSTVFADKSSLLFVLFGVNSTRQTVNTFSVLNTETWTWTSDYQSSYSGSDSSRGDSRGFPEATLAGIVVGCAVGVGIVVGVIVYLCLRKRRHKRKQVNRDDKSLRMKPEEAGILQPMSPLLPDEPAPAYRPHSDDSEYLYSYHHDKGDSNTSYKDGDPIFLRPTKKPDEQELENGRSDIGKIIMSPEKPDGASTIPRNRNIRSMKPDGG